MYCIVWQGVRRGFIAVQNMFDGSRWPLFCAGGRRCMRFRRRLRRLRFALGQRAAQSHFTALDQMVGWDRRAEMESGRCAPRLGLL